MVRWPKDLASSLGYVCKEGGGVNHAFAARLGAFRMARRGERARQSYKLHRPKELEDISTLCHF